MGEDQQQPPRGENESLIKAMEKYYRPEKLTVEAPSEAGAKVLVVPHGMRVHSLKQYLDEYRLVPDRRRGTASLTTLQSFCDHVLRFADGHSALFADDSAASPRLVAVLNYHEGGAGGPRFGDHRAVYTFPLSDEWQLWTRATAPMSQDKFAQFIEDRIQDLIDPAQAGESTWKFVEQLEIVLATPSALMALSKGLTVYVDARATHTVNLSSGEGQLSFTEEHKDAQGAPLKVPRGFAIAIPVFANGERYTLPIRLRYRVASNKVTWSLVPHRVDLVFRHAFVSACNEAVEKTKLPLFYGKPEE